MINEQLLDLIRATGFLTDADLTAQQKYDLLTLSFWRKVEELGYNQRDLKRKLWQAAGRPEEALIALLPEVEIQKGFRATDKTKDPKKKIKAAAESVILLYKRGEKEIEAAILNNMDNPDRMRAETRRIRRNLLQNAAAWLGVAVPGLYLAGSKTMILRGPHAGAAMAMANQEMNRFKEIDAQLSRHVEQVIADSEKRRVTAELTGTTVDYTGVSGKIIGYKGKDGSGIGLADYAHMLAITAARNLFNEGTLNRIRENGQDLAMISREVRSNSCQVCRNWAGKIVSISGNSKEYPALDTAVEEGLLHPHCIHTLAPVGHEGST